MSSIGSAVRRSQSTNAASTTAASRKAPSVAPLAHPAVGASMSP